MSHNSLNSACLLSSPYPSPLDECSCGETVKRKAGNYIEVQSVRYCIDTAAEKDVACQAIQESGFKERPIDHWNGERWDRTLVGYLSGYSDEDW